LQISHLVPVFYHSTPDIGAHGRRIVAELVRVAALTGYLETMAGFAVDPRPLLREQGLNADQLAKPENLIPATAAIRLLERSAQETGCVTLGLRMAEGRSIANLGAASLLMAYQPSLRHTLAALGEFRTRINSTLVLHVEEDGDQVILREDFAMRRPEPWRQSSNLVLGVLAGLCGSMLGAGWVPAAACFRHEAPPADQLAIFRRIFRCTPQFDSDMDCLVIATADLDRPNPLADAALARHARLLLEAVMNPAARSTVEDVDQQVRMLLPSGRASIQTCAGSLGLPVRTLQRMLDAEGESFSSLLGRIRMQLAIQYLANPRMRIADIAGLLGYSTTGAFTRWHAQNFGMPPRSLRRQNAIDLHAGRKSSSTKTASSAAVNCD
jgi:AraC-like DNA-binding protein